MVTVKIMIMMMVKIMIAMVVKIVLMMMVMLMILMMVKIIIMMMIKMLVMVSQCMSSNFKRNRKQAFLKSCSSLLAQQLQPSLSGAQSSPFLSGSPIF